MNEDILHEVLVSNGLDKSEEDTAIGLLGSGDLISTNDLRFETKSYHSINSDEVLYIYIEL